MKEHGKKKNFTIPELGADFDFLPWLREKKLNHDKNHRSMSL
jgi:hypothetical protein